MILTDREAHSVNAIDCICVACSSYLMLMKHIFICMLSCLHCGDQGSMLKGGSDDLHLDPEFRTFSVVHKWLFGICVDPDVRIHAMQRFDIWLLVYSIDPDVDREIYFTGISVCIKRSRAIVYFGNIISLVSHHVLCRL